MGRRGAQRRRRRLRRISARSAPSRSRSSPDALLSPPGRLAPDGPCGRGMAAPPSRPLRHPRGPCALRLRTSSPPPPSGVRPRSFPPRARSALRLVLAGASDVLPRGPPRAASSRGRRAPGPLSPKGCGTAVGRMAADRFRTSSNALLRRLLFRRRRRWIRRRFSSRPAGSPRGAPAHRRTGYAPGPPRCGGARGSVGSSRARRGSPHAPWAPRPRSFRRGNRLAWPPLPDHVENPVADTRWAGGRAPDPGSPGCAPRRGGSRLRSSRRRRGLPLSRIGRALPHARSRPPALAGDRRLPAHRASDPRSLYRVVILGGDRYLEIAVGPLALAAGTGAYVAARRGWPTRVFVVAAIGLVVAAQAGYLSTYFSGREKRMFREAVGVMTAESRPGDAFLTSLLAERLPVEFYARGRVSFAGTSPPSSGRLWFFSESPTPTPAEARLIGKGFRADASWDIGTSWSLTSLRLTRYVSR